MSDTNNELNGLIATLDEYLVKKAPFQIPDAGKEFLVRFGPWISLILLVITLPILLIALGVGTFLIPFGGFAYATGFGLAAIFAFLEIGLLVLALPGLFARKLSGWTFLFYEQLVHFAGALVTGAIVAGIVGTIIGLYILFQVREKYRP